MDWKRPANKYLRRAEYIISARVVVKRVKVDAGTYLAPATAVKRAPIRVRRSAKEMQKDRRQHQADPHVKKCRVLLERVKTDSYVVTPSKAGLTLRVPKNSVVFSAGNCGVRLVRLTRAEVRLTAVRGAFPGLHA